MNKYKALKIGGVKIDEHRYVMQKHLGRVLDRLEHEHNVSKLARDFGVDRATINRIKRGECWKHV